MRKFKKHEVVTRILLFFVISVILIFTLQVSIFQIGAFLELDYNLNINLVRSVNGIVGMGLVFVFLKFDRLKFDIIGLSWDKTNGTKYLILGFPLALIGLIFTLIIENFSGILDIGGFIEPILLIITFITTFFCIALGEEVIFRGYIQGFMESTENFNFITATIVSAFTFGLLHFLLIAPNKDASHMIAILFSAFIIGLVFSYAYRITKYNLLLAISIHGFWDFIIFMFDINFVYNDLSMALLEVFASAVGAFVIFILLYITNQRYPHILNSASENVE